MKQEEKGREWGRKEKAKRSRIAGLGESKVELSAKRQGWKAMAE